jgi:hypothetical protein
MIKTAFISPMFNGRFKTVKEKDVSYTGESQKFFYRNSGPRYEPAPPFSFPAVMTGIGAGAGIIALLPTPAPVSGIVGAVSAGLAVPGGSGATATLMDRRVSYYEKQVPMTPEEEWAVMTPLERANTQVDQALTKWQVVREKHLNKIQDIDKTLTDIQAALQSLLKEFEPIDQQYQQLKDKSDTEKRLVLKGENWIAFENRVRQLKMRLDAKQRTNAEQQELKTMALNVYQALDGEIVKREQQLYETKESLNLMAQRQSVLEMNKELNAVKSTASSNTDAHPAQSLELSNPDTILALEKQKVEIETLMASIKTAMDVDAVLKSVSQDSKK